MEHKKKVRALLVMSQPIQNPKVLQLLAQDHEIEIQVAYCSMPNQNNMFDNIEHLNKQVFDIPMLEGYPWLKIPNISPYPSLSKFWGLINPQVVKLASEFECIVVFGHAYATFVMAIITAKLLRKPLILSTDATYLESSTGSNWKVPIKQKFIPFLYNQIADAVIVPSTASKLFLSSLGVREEKIFVTPYVVNNDDIISIAKQTDRLKIRKEWQIPIEAKVIVFCGKFLERKSPLDLIQAFAKVDTENTYLVMVGDGPLAEVLKTEVNNLNIASKVRFLGLVKYSKLPEVYASCDLLVHPAKHEPYGLIVNEAMLCSCPVITSDRVGARLDLIEEGKTGFTYLSGNIDVLAKLLNNLLPNESLLQEMSHQAYKKVQTWSATENVEQLKKAIDQVMLIGTN